ncbi:MAG: mannose-1-phosphate guanylyltransferase [Prevotella sp.]|nr:mannose-1-phosphate guanylyltransferase [Prevotella sp.]
MEYSKDFCVILAGGRGKRLWPCSRETMPKQFIDFFGTGRTQLQATYDRIVKLLPVDHIYVCTCRDYLELSREQLPDVPELNFIVEPINRNTAPSVAWAAVRILRRQADANLIVLPSDQMVLNEASFSRSVELGFSYVAENDVLMVMGVKPTRPEPGYGYIQMGDMSCKPDVYAVKSFTEKPEREFATLFMNSGEFYWNTGIFLSNVSFLLKSFEQIFPDVLRKLKYDRLNFTYEEEMEFVAHNYPRYPNISLDYAVLEQCKNVFVMQCDFGWADLGTWHAIYESMSKVEGDNVVIDSMVELEDCKNNVIKLPKGKIGVFNGLEGYIVADSEDVLLVCKKNDDSSLIRKYASEIGLKYGDGFV